MVRIPALVIIILMAAADCLAARIVATNENWSGKTILEGDVLVKPEAVLTLEPGAQLVFPANAALTVEGRLMAKGTKEKPVLLRGRDGSGPNGWRGVFFGGAVRGSELENVHMENASTGLSAAGSLVSVTDSAFKNCAKGILLATDTRFKVKATALSEMTEGGIEIATHSLGEVLNCRIEKTGEFGIALQRQTSAHLAGNSISDVKTGVIISGGSHLIEENIIERCETGIAASQAEPSLRIKGNTLRKCGRAVACHQFASPLIEGNVIEENETGIECFQASSPSVTGNRLEKNGTALACIQLCAPEFIKNAVRGNASGVYLHLSSYAKITGNNFEANKYDIELDNMSYDWESRAGKKPVRQRQARNQTLVKQGRALPEKFEDDVVSEGFVDARGNYWGPETTSEMAAKGAQADISTIKDGFDVPTRTYEGWPGVYKVDKVRYDGWAKEPFPDAGPTQKK